MGEPILLLTVPEVAERLRVSRRTVYRLIEDGRIRVLHPVPGRTVISDREITAFVASLTGRRVA
jgi:excisionase family DNA binding protein